MSRMQSRFQDSTPSIFAGPGKLDVKPSLWREEVEEEKEARIMIVVRALLRTADVLLTVTRAANNATAVQR